MVRYENECVGCDSALYPCEGSSCPRLKVPHYLCDNPKCRAEETLYHTEDGDFCAECLLERFEKVEGSY